MADELVCRFDPAAAHGIASLAGKAIVKPLLMPLQVGDQFRDLLSGRGIRRLHPLQPPDDAVDFPVLLQKSKSAIFDGCNPLKYRDTLLDKSVKNQFLQQNRDGNSGHAEQRRDFAYGHVSPLSRVAISLQSYRPVYNIPAPGGRSPGNPWRG